MGLHKKQGSMASGSEEWRVLSIKASLAQQGIGATKYFTVAGMALSIFRSMNWQSWN